MLASLARRAFAAPRAAIASKFQFAPMRAMSAKVPEDQGHFATSKEQAIGKARSEEAYVTAFNQEFFDRDALAVFEEGTKENPIQILSNEHERYVGVSVEDDSNIRWMLLKEGELAYDPVTMNYFALNYVSEHAIEEAVAEAEKAW